MIYNYKIINNKFKKFFKFIKKLQNIYVQIIFKLYLI